MKLRTEKLMQPTLADEFHRRKWPLSRPQKVRVVRVVRHVHVSAEEERMAKRREADGEQMRKTQEFKRLIGNGMSRAEASRQVYG